MFFSQSLDWGGFGLVSVAVEIKDLKKSYGTGSLMFQALRGIDLSINVGEFLMLSGPSGRGKTTLLSIIGCVLRASSGRYRLFGEEISGRPERFLPDLRLSYVGFIFQGHNLLASLSALDNVKLLLELRGFKASQAIEESERLLTLVGLGSKMTNRPRELSGGQRQRVAIARALAGNPPLILADEPTAALDAANGLKITELLKELAKKEGRTVLVVTHDNRIYHLADRIIHMEDGHIVHKNGEEDDNA